MKEIFVMLNTNIKQLFKKTSTWIIVLLCLQLFTIWLITYIYLELSDGQYHFYMNTKTSLENIHNVTIDNYDGNIAHKLTTEEQLLRKNNRRWHLKFMFK